MDAVAISCNNAGTILPNYSAARQERVVPSSNTRDSSVCEMRAVLNPKRGVSFYPTFESETMSTSSKHKQATSQPTPTTALAAMLRASGQRVTSQRLLILSAFAQPGEHLTADEVYSRVEPIVPALNRSTVYRTLELFRDIGLISETDLGGGVRHFELLGGARHHHLICQECGLMDEMDDALVEPLREAVRERYGFVSGIDHMAVFGLCAYCAEHRKPATE
jgi:Fur family ferric uptake transcriptional regulator